MARFLPQGIRGRVTLLAGVVTACAMVLIVIGMGFTTRVVLENAISDSLRERLEQAREAVENGDYALAIDATGNEIIQVIDANGKVVVVSPNASGLAAIADEDAEDEVEVESLELKIEQDSDEVPADEAEMLYAPTSSFPSATEPLGEVSARPDEVLAPSSENAAADSDDDMAADDADAEADGYNDSTNVGADDAEDEDDAGDDEDTHGDDGEDDDDGPDDDAKSDDDDSDDSDESGGDSDDSDDDDNDDEGRKSDDSKPKAKKAGSSIDSASKAVNSNTAFPLADGFAFVPLAWADEPASGMSPQAGDYSADSLATLDAESILGIEGPYLILREHAESPDGPMTLVAVTSLAQANRSAVQMTWSLVAVMAVLLVFVIALTWTITGRTLSSVESMRAKAASISAENLSERIDVPHGDKDLARLAETLNEMLTRVERSLEEEKRFISDASHELKSPIAATSIILDSLRAHPDEADMPQALEDLAHENARMASIIGDMLALTRYDEGRMHCSLEPVDVMDIVLEETLTLKSRTGIEADISGLQPVTCHADPRLLGHALRNLLDNAARYATSTVRVSCGEDARGTIVITVSDDGRGIAPADRERVFGRFVCLEESRSGSKGGTGLGLAVVASIASAHGGTVAFVEPELGGATARLELPARPPSSSPLPK